MMDLTGTLVKLNSQTAGRDKLCRIVQYGSKLAWWYFQTHNKTDELVVKLKHLEYSLSTTRKILRFGKSIDILHSALKTIRMRDLTLGLLITFSKIANSLYLFVDNILLLERLKLIKIHRAFWSELSNKYWLTMLIINLTRDVNEVYVSVMREIVFQDKKRELSAKHSPSNKTPKRSEMLVKCLKENRVVLLDTVKNSCDIVIPMSSLGYLSASPGVQGFCGVISSILGIIPLIEPTMKMMPS